MKITAPPSNDKIQKQNIWSFEEDNDNIEGLETVSVTLVINVIVGGGGGRTMLVELEPFAANLKKNIPRIMIIFKVKEEELL